MASLMLRSARAWAPVASRTLSTTSAVGKDKMMNDPIDHATGVEKYELLAKQQGNDDPFFMKAFARGKGTRDEPNIVNAMDAFRIVGCHCNSTDTHINWMVVFDGKPKRCECGYWFKLKRHEAPTEATLPL